MTAWSRGVMLSSLSSLLMSTATGAGTAGNARGDRRRGYVAHAPRRAGVRRTSVIARVGHGLFDRGIDPTADFEWCRRKMGVHQFLVSVPGIDPLPLHGDRATIRIAATAGH